MDKINNLADGKYYDSPELKVVEWHPLPNGEGNPTQVHLVFKLGTGHVILRLKSKVACESLIMALQQHSASVWPLTEKEKHEN